MSAIRVLLVFVDGLGIGEAHERNPFWHESFPGLERICAGSTTSLRSGDWQSRGEALLVALDATFGVPGLPQSATGQTALLAGVKAPVLLGRHIHAYPTKQLRSMLQQSNVLSEVVKMGFGATFLNAYTSLVDGLPVRKRLSCTSVATMAAGIPFRNLADLRAKRSVYHDITGLSLQKRGYDTPLRSPEEAGEIAVRIAAEHHLTLFEYFMTDLAGHSKRLPDCLEVLRVLDRFMASVLDLADRTGILVAMTSDHGNIEDISTQSHTTNPVPLALYGASEQTKQRAREAIDLSDVAAILTESIMTGGLIESQA